LEADADVHATDANGRTPLHTARSPAIAIQLLANDADPMAKDNLGETPAVFKASQHNLERFGYQGSKSAMLRLNDIGTAHIMRDWVQSAHLLPASQSLAWAKFRHKRLNAQPLARLPVPLWRRIGLLIEIGQMEINQGVLAQYIWARFKVWLQMRTELQRAAEARKTVSVLRKFWDEAGDGVYGDVSAVKEAIADELMGCSGLLGLLLTPYSVANDSSDSDDDSSDDGDEDSSDGDEGGSSIDARIPEPQPEVDSDPEPEDEDEKLLPAPTASGPAMSWDEMREWDRPPDTPPPQPG
jgi:hypothetical protein